MGVKVSKPSIIYMENMSVVLNTTNHGRALNKKHIALSYHYVREHVANKVVSVRKIDSKENYADAFTKGLNLVNNNGFFYEILSN